MVSSVRIARVLRPGLCLSVFAGVVLLGVVAFGNSCPEITVEAAAAESEGVFLGEFRGIKRDSHQDKSLLTFAIVRGFRGPSGDTVVLHQSGGFPNPFHEGERYLVFADLVNGSWVTDSCLPNSVWSEAVQAELARSVAGVSSESESFGSAKWAPVTLLVLVVATLVRRRLWRSSR